MQPASLGARGLCIYPAILSGVRAGLSCLLAAVLTAGKCCAQQPTLETPQQTNDRIRSISFAAQKIQRDYQIGPGDLLSVEVFDVEELTRDTRVSQAGTIALPLVPVRLHVAGLTEVQAERKLAEVLEANGLVTHPQVSVTVKEKKSKPITIVGAVNHPIVYQADRSITLLEALSEAGGIANDAGNTVIVTRHPSEQSDAISDAANDTARSSEPMRQTQTTAEAERDPGKQPAEGATGAQVQSGGGNSQPPILLTVDLNELLESGDPKHNLVLEAGDIVTVPHSGIVYVVGAVDRPGGFVLSNDRSQMTTLKVLSLAGGLRRTARADAAVILRKDTNGQQQQVAVNLKKVLAREHEDVVLRPSDILFVPESGGKRAAIKIAEIALGVATAAAVFRVARN